jgi:hypothetical protein
MICWVPLRIYTPPPPLARPSLLRPAPCPTVSTTPIGACLRGCFVPRTPCSPRPPPPKLSAALPLSAIPTHSSPLRCSSHPHPSGGPALLLAPSQIQEPIISSRPFRLGPPPRSCPSRVHFLRLPPRAPRPPCSAPSTRPAIGSLTPCQALHRIPAPGGAEPPCPAPGPLGRPCRAEPRQRS